MGPEQRSHSPPGALCAELDMFFSSLCYETGTMLYKLYSLLHFVKYICGLRWTYILGATLDTVAPALS